MNPKRTESHTGRDVNLPDIIGSTKAVKRHLLPKPDSDSHGKVNGNVTDNFDQEIDEENVEIRNPQEELDEVFDNALDIEEEEKEYRAYGISDDDNGFAQGVTFEELSAVGMVLQLEKPEPSLERQAATIVHKIQGTELFSLLESSVEGASQKIAMLLDRSLSAGSDASSIKLRNENPNGFDIGDFV
ncbi:conjugal transfer protein TraD [Chryseobacterium sp. IHB B 17019]|uniref:conjugal transfer protein TraD n=1 Tax=Chryseobacterium sp. IHB B 17019 TaxID=1721091 RepID=UPI002FF7BB92